MAKHNIQGKKGEEIALRHIRGKGYDVKAVNWRSGRDELDIIAEYENTLIIIEVKTRKSDYHGRPEEFVTKSKQKRIIKAANDYIERNDISTETRFDIIAILLNGGNIEIDHIEDAFYALV